MTAGLLDLAFVLTLSVRLTVFSDLNLPLNTEAYLYTGDFDIDGRVDVGYAFHLTALGVEASVDMSLVGSPHTSIIYTTGYVS